MTREAHLGRDHLEAATIWHNLDGIEHARGRRSVKIRTATLGAEHPRWPPTSPRWPRSSSNRGAWTSRPFTGARSRSSRRRWRPSTAKPAVNCNNLGALQAARGKLADAQQLYDRALQIKTRLLGLAHPDVAMTLHNLAVLHAGARPHRRGRDRLRARAVDLQGCPRPRASTHARQPHRVEQLRQEPAV